MTQKQINDAIAAGIAQALAQMGGKAPVAAPPVNFTIPDGLKMPEGKLHAALFSALYIMAQENLAGGKYGPTVHSRFMAERLAEDHITDGYSPEEVKRAWLELELGGFIYRYSSKSKIGGYTFVPVALSTPRASTVGRASKDAEASSRRRRIMEQMENRAVASIDDKSGKTKVA